MHLFVRPADAFSLHIGGISLVSRDLGVSYPRHTWWYRSFLAVVRPIVMPIVKMKMKIK